MAASSNPSVLFHGDRSCCEPSPRSRRDLRAFGRGRHVSDPRVSPGTDPVHDSFDAPPESGPSHPILPERPGSCFALGLAFVLGCSVGVGTGEISGTVTAPQCGLDGEYSLNPDFYSARAFEEQLTIRIQKGGDFPLESDGISIVVLDASRETERLGTPIAFTGEPEAPVAMSFYLNDTCRPDEDELPVYLQAVAGSITFEQIYAPELDEGRRETAGTFSGVVFTDGRGERVAVLDGEFRFLFERGRPGQPFP